MHTASEFTPRAPEADPVLASDTYSPLAPPPSGLARTFAVGTRVPGSARSADVPRRRKIDVAPAFGSRCVKASKLVLPSSLTTRSAWIDNTSELPVNQGTLTASRSTAFPTEEARCRYGCGRRPSA